MKNFEVIIVGAGPAGALAGYHLDRAGLEVCLFDKSQFPRRKMCGGGLTRRALLEIPFDMTHVIHQAVSWGEIRFRGRLISRIQGDKPIAYMIDRSTFDAYLLDQAVALGAKQQLGERVESNSQQNDTVQVQTSKDSYRCRYLIGADGVYSIVTQQTDLLRKRRTSLAYEALMICQANPRGESVTFDFGTILGGYGWVFPKRDHLNVGVCQSWPGKRASKRHLLRFIDQHPSLHREDVINIRAYPVPLGGEKTVLHKNRILLAGDAVNLGDPWLGEGLYYAFVSGRMAAEAIQRHAEGGSTNLSGHTSQINDQLIGQMTYARRLSLLINLLPGINVAFLKSSPILQKIIIDLLRGDQSYQQVWQSLKAHPLRFLLRIIQGK